MIKLWSELPRARSREMLADFTTLIWVVFWGVVVWRLFEFLSSFAEAGRSVQAGGETMVQGGRDLGESLAGLPLVGAQVRDITRDAFAGAGTPLAAFGTELERFIFVIAVVIALLLALVTLQPWLSRYLPWRLGRVRRVRAAHQAIRTGYRHCPIPTRDGCSRCEPSAGSSTPICSSTRPTRSATGRPDATRRSPGPSLPARDWTPESGLDSRVGRGSTMGPWMTCCRSGGSPGCPG